jgi:tRNA G18 (ribose-2'-O)-methylase SpoU
MYLTGYTPYPKDRFGRPQKEIAKTALGAESVIPWEKRQDVIALLKRLKRDRWRIVGVEQDERSVDYRKIKVETPTVFVFGNEVRGLSRTVRNVCDALIEIPMSGTKESLNVSVAAGIVLFSTLR